MSDLLKKPSYIPSGEITAENVSIEDYFANYYEQAHEYIQGVVIKMSPGTITHTLLIDYFYELFKAYLRIKRIGRAFRESSLRSSDSVRVPDVFFVLADTHFQITKTGIEGVPDLCIEVVSEDSIGRDYGDKFLEYETIGVREYWIIDPLRQRTTFYRMAEDGHYSIIQPDVEGNFETLILPKLKIHVPMLWQEALPDMLDSYNHLKNILGD
jgi:Uma2 family endonuclease